jgi:hypothetical protein
MDSKYFRAWSSVAAVFTSPAMATIALFGA